MKRIIFLDIQTLNNDDMNEKLSNKEDIINGLRSWLTEHGYYVGNHRAAEALRELANIWDD